MQRHRHFSFRRNGQNLRIFQPDGSRVRTVETRREDFLGSPVPSGTVNDGLAIWRKAGVPDDAIAESHFVEAWIRPNCAALRKAIDSRPGCKHEESRNC